MTNKCLLRLIEIFKDAERKWEMTVYLPFCPTNGMTIVLASKDEFGDIREFPIELRDLQYIVFQAQWEAWIPYRYTEYLIADEGPLFMTGIGWTLVEELRDECRHYCFAGMLGKKTTCGMDIPDGC